MEHISGGVCAPIGFKAGGVHCGIRKNRVKRDIALIISEVPASASAVYTTNLVKGAPIYVTQRNIADGIAQAAICNSGNANTCNADGEDVAWQMCQLTAQATGLKAEDVIVASTGVIGQPLSIEPIKAGMAELYASVHANGSQEAAEAIMTTDTKLKEVAVSFVAGGKTCKDLGSFRIYEKRLMESPVVREYKRSYKAHNARVSKGMMTRDEFNAWSVEAREKRDMCLRGEYDFEEFVEWLDSDRMRARR